MRLEVLEWCRLNSKRSTIPRRKTIVTVNADGTKKFIRSPGHLMCTQMHRWTTQKELLGLEVAMQPYGQPSRLKLTFKFGLVVEKEIPKTAEGEVIIDDTSHAYVQYQAGLQVVTYGANHLDRKQMINVMKKGRLKQAVGMKQGPQVDIRMAAIHNGDLVHYTKTGHTAEKLPFHV